MTDRTPDVVSPITDSPLADRVPLQEARAAGRFGHSKPTVANSVVLLIDHQVGLMASLRDTSTAAEIKSNAIGLARVAQALSLPLLPTLSLCNDGYAVFPVLDAAGAWNHYEAQAATARMVQAGAQPVSTFALAAELQEDWKHPWADAMLAPFHENLSEYGWVTQNFWDNHGRKAVADPFASA